MNYISLGYFCSVASELERFGLRKESLPFDWLISDFPGVINAISDHFCHLWTEEYWAQNKNDRTYYKHSKYGFEFCHDFDKFRPLSVQLPEVAEKYNRRIDRFYRAIKDPTVFIRYISDEHCAEGVSLELLYIEQHYEEILRLLKSYNSENSIIFIANSGVVSSKIPIYHVEKDPNDTVARLPFDKSPQLHEYFEHANYPLDMKNTNLQIYRQKQNQKTTRRIKRYIKNLWKRLLFSQYRHHRCY